jgi:fluoroacetyl-CoA thioesterase
MKSTLLPGLKHSTELKVTPSMTVPEISDALTAFADMPPVFATAFMVGFIETTCIECIAPHLDEGEHSVGTSITVSHIAATPVGMTVRAEVELTETNKRSLVFTIAAYDDSGLIGEGTHHRAVIDVERFMAKVNEKAQSV